MTADAAGEPELLGPVAEERSSDPSSAMTSSAAASDLESSSFATAAALLRSHTTASSVRRNIVAAPRGASPETSARRTNSRISRRSRGSRWAQRRASAMLLRRGIRTLAWDPRWSKPQIVRFQGVVWFVKVRVGSALRPHRTFRCSPSRCRSRTILRRSHPRCRSRAGSACTRPPSSWMGARSWSWTPADYSVPLERLPRANRFGRRRSARAARYACQPGSPLTPPPAWVADDPW